MKSILVLAGVAAAFGAGAAERTLTMEAFRDKMEGAWLGQSVGVAYGAPTEFSHSGKLIPADKMPKWKPEMVNGTFCQDDLYVEMTFMKTLSTRGLDVTSREAGIDFANSAYRLWCANCNARNNLRSGIAAPACSHPKYHKSPDDIDYQIEADYSGILAPGLPQAAVDLGETFGRIMNYGDGLYAGQFVGAMYAEAYFEPDVVKVVEKALKAIPQESKYAQMVSDMLAWHEADPKNWGAAWTNAVAKYQSREFVGKVTWPAIDVKINGAMTLLGLLFGEGDMDKTMYISTIGGYDSDCNPSSACGVLGTIIGKKKLDPKYWSALDRTKKWEYTAYSWDSLLAESEKLVRGIVVKYGGRIEKGADGAETLVLPQKDVKPSAFYDSKAPGPEPENPQMTEAEKAQVRYVPGKFGAWSVEKPGPVKIIFDTDMITDFDDVGALACLHAMADAGECEILATVSSTRGNASVGAVEVINAYYGRADLPVGAPKGMGVVGAYAGAKEKVDPTAPLGAKTGGDGGHYKYRKMVADYPQWVKHVDADDAPDANEVYRKVLAAAPDKSVVICSVGFLTNLRRLLETKPDAISPLDGKALVAKKVKRWVAMACSYPRGKEYNSKHDWESSKIALENWPTPIVFSDFQYGMDCFAGRAVAEMKGPRNPVKDVFAGTIPSREETKARSAELLCGCYGMGGRAAWDETAVLAAVRGTERYFNVHRGTYRMIGTAGEDEWAPDEENGPHVRITEKLSKTEVGKIIDELICRGPKRRR